MGGSADPPCGAAASAMCQDASRPRARRARRRVAASTPRRRRMRRADRALARVGLGQVRPRLVSSAQARLGMIGLALGARENIEQFALRVVVCEEDRPLTTDLSCHSHLIAKTIGLTR